MAVLRVTSFTVDPAQTEEMLAKRAVLIAAIKDAFPALTETRLARVDETHWIDTWRWNSLAEAQAAIAHAPSMPEAGAAFALTAELNGQFAELVEEG